MQFVLASHNKKKLAELSAIVSSLGIEIIPLPEGAPEPEEMAKPSKENALIKRNPPQSSPVCPLSRTTAACAWMRWTALPVSIPRATARVRTRTAMPSY